MKRNEWVEFSKSFSDRDSQLLIRTYDTIMSNVYDDKGYPWSPYRCISPGKLKFNGIWNWDSAFHTVGVARWDTALAKESVLGFAKFQKENGLLPDVIFENGAVMDWYSKPPVFAWAIEAVIKRIMI